MSLLYCRWHPNLHLTKKDGTINIGAKCKISPNQFHRYRMMDRDSSTKPEFNAIISGGRLFQEWYDLIFSLWCFSRIIALSKFYIDTIFEIYLDRCCGMFYLSEKCKLDWAKSNQKKIKAEKYSGLLDAVNVNDDLKEVGIKVILPPSHIGRYIIFLSWEKNLIY